MKAECESKTKLLRTAIELISENSYGSVSVDDICKRSEVKKGSFYHFFPSKSDLTVAAMEADWQSSRSRLDGFFSAQVAPLDRLRKYLESVIACQASKQAEYGKICGCPMITLGAELSTQDENIRQKAHQVIERYIRYFESAIRDAVEAGDIESENPRTLAEQLFACVQGTLLQAKIQNDLHPLRGLGDSLDRLLGRPLHPV